MLSSGISSGIDGNVFDLFTSSSVGTTVWPWSSTLSVLTVPLLIYAKVKLVRKNIVANTAVVRDRKFAEPFAPNIVPEAPAPKA